MKHFSFPSPTSSICFAGVSVFALSSSLLACVIDDSPPRHFGGDGTPSAAVPPPSGSTSTTTPSSPAPMLVVVDTDKVLQADPGQGVGIFTEYGAGGKWHIWWTCDTTMSGLPCDVVLSATATSGTITNVDASQLASANGVVSDPTASRVEARVTTTTQVHGITFETNAGAIITLQATIGGLSTGPGQNKSFFFFVQDGKINGGYTGALTNPLQLQGSAP